MERLASALDDRAEDTARLVTAETGMPESLGAYVTAKSVFLPC